MKAKFDGNHLLSIENSLKISSNIEICSKILVSINFANLYPPLVISRLVLLDILQELSLFLNKVLETDKDNVGDKGRSGMGL